MKSFLFHGRFPCNIREASNTDFDINQQYGQRIFTFEKFKQKWTFFTKLRLVKLTISFHQTFVYVTFIKRSIKNSNNVKKMKYRKKPQNES